MQCRGLLSGPDPVLERLRAFDTHAFAQEVVSAIPTIEYVCIAFPMRSIMCWQTVPGEKNMRVLTAEEGGRIRATMHED